MKKYLFEILVILIFVLSRLPSLGHDNFTTDTWKWKSRTYDFGSGIFQLDFQKTLQKYHPGVTLMWLGTAGVKVYNLSYNLIHGTDPADNDISTVFQLDFVQKLFVVFAIGLVLAFALRPLRKMFGDFTAALIGLVVAFEPYFIALSRVFHLEGLLSVFMFASVVWMFWYLRERHFRRLAVSAIFAGLAILTKTTALFLLPFAFLMFTVWELSDEGLLHQAANTLPKRVRTLIFFRNVFSDFIKWLLISSSTIFLLWPALWVIPSEVYTAIYKGVAVVGIEREHVQYYFGRLVEDPGPSFYPVVFIYKTSLVLFIGLVGLSLVFRKLSKERKQLIMFLLSFALLYVLAITLPTKKLDRYIVPALITLAATSALFYEWCWSKVKISVITKILITTIILVLSVFYLHPDYLTYYNPVLGGLKKGISALEPKWLIGERELVRYFEGMLNMGTFSRSHGTSIEKLIDTEQTDRILIVALQEKYYTQAWPFFREIGAWPVIEDLTGQSRYAQFFVYPVWDDRSVDEKRFKLAYDGSVYIRGVETYKVYRKN